MRGTKMNREHVMREAERHCKLTAGWMFDQPGIIAFWEAAFAAGAAAEREACAKVCEQAGVEGYGTLAAAAMIRGRGER